MSVFEEVVQWRLDNGKKVFFAQSEISWVTTVVADSFLLPLSFGTVEIEDGYFIIKDDGVVHHDPNRELARTPIHNDFDAFVAWCRMVDELSGIRYEG